MSDTARSRRAEVEFPSPTIIASRTLYGGSMARLDALIDRLLTSGSLQLVIDTDVGAVLQTANGPVHVIQQPLTIAQIAAALAEIGPAEARRALAASAPTAFSYSRESGHVDVRFEAIAGGARATIAPAAAIASNPAAAEGRARSVVQPARAMEVLLETMLERRASDLHLSSDNPPMFRIDGDMVAWPEFGPIPSTRLREMLWTIAPERNREEYDRCRDTDFAHETPAARFRANLFADRKGIGAVFRQIPNNIVTAEDMGLSQHVLDLCFLTKGLVLVTGPTGSGKSTTLAAMIDYVNRNRDDHVITVEDPIEFVHANKRCLVNQREVSVHTESFKRALRAALREDPDVILVGELRDLETIAIAIETAETGHLVFGTLHTNTAASTVDRIIDQFPTDRQEQVRMMLSESLKGVISQTLCKKVGGGRVAAQEVLLCSTGVSNLIREGKTFQIPSLMQTAGSQGMVTLNAALFDLVKRHLVDPKDALAKAVAKSELRQMFVRAGIVSDQQAA